MKKFNIIIIFFYLSFEVLYAQQVTKTEFSHRPMPDPKIKNLKVGERVPEILIPKIIRNTRSNAKISDFKDQLVIFDFFDTFCGSCIEALPKLDSLQKQFGNKIKILPVSYQSETVMETFFNTNKFIAGKNIQLPCVVEDNILGSYFQYKLISHEVWVYKGIVKAITGTDYITAKNIQDILDGNDVNWPVKNDMVNFDPNASIFVQNQSDQYNTKNELLNHSGISGYRNGIDWKQGIKSTYDSINHVYRTFFYNFDIVAAFRALSSLTGSTPLAENSSRTVFLTPGRLIFNVKDKSKYVYDKSYGFRSDWERENKFCYELTTAKLTDLKTRLKYVKQDLCLKLGLTVEWEKRKINCLVLVKTKEVSNLDSLNKVRMEKFKDSSKIDLGGLKLMYFELNGKYPPVIDETKFKGQMVFGGDTSFEGIKKQLNIYGYDIIRAERETDVLVITEI